MQETWVRSLGWEDSLEKGNATHSSFLAWRILWTEEPDRLQSMGLQSQAQRCKFHFQSKSFKKGITNKEQKRVPLLEVRYKCRAEPRKKKKWYWYGWASCLSYWIARAIYKTVTCSKIRCFKLWKSIDFFQRALYFTESESCHLNITQIFHLLLLFYP